MLARVPGIGCRNGTPSRQKPGPMKEKISLPMARRITLAAQGFADPAPTGTIDRRHLQRVLSRVGLFQIDSVAAVVRAHYMPLYSRLGSYPMALLDDAIEDSFPASDPPAMTAPKRS